MRNYLIAGNWKLHGDRHSVAHLLAELKAGVQTLAPSVELAVFPPFVYLEQVALCLQGTPIAWGAQTVSGHQSGAFTGEVSAKMLTDFGCRYVIIGHSERRTLFGETQDRIAAQYRLALDVGLCPIFCIGETLSEREAGLTDVVLAEQLRPLLHPDLDLEDLRRTVIAYEPVWAIGTGVTAQPEVAQAVHYKVRTWIAERDKKVASVLRILYGGSLKLENASALLSMPDIDGGLIGGASLNPIEFLEIARLCCN